jgi:hypothetical protein
MGSCCASNERPENELNTNPTTRTDLKSSGPPADESAQTEYAALTLQKHFKGMLTRRAIKQQYGFEARTHLMGRDGNLHT